MMNIGFVTAMSGRWPRELPQERDRLYGDYMQKEFPSAKIIRCGYLVDSAARAKEAAHLFKRENVNLIVMVYGAFTGDDICTCLAEESGVPIIMWAPFEPPFDGGRLLANALVALTMNAASMNRLGYANHAIYGSFDDDKAADRLRKVVKSYETVEKLSGKLLGLFGYRPTAFYNSAFDEALIRRIFKVRIEETSLKVVFDVMGDIDSELVKKDMDSISGKYDTCLPEGHLENHSRLYLALKQVMKAQGYDYSALKCWPEMGVLKTTPCAVLSRLADDGFHIGCEGDVDAALTLMLQNTICGKPAFVTDMINIDEAENFLTFWHCGNAAPSLMDSSQPIELRNHPLAGQGSAFYGGLKTGVATIARLCNIQGVYKLFLSKGTALPTKPNTKGVMTNIQIKSDVRDFVYQLIDWQVPHHYSIVWEDIADDMKCAAKLLGIDVLEI